MAILEKEVLITLHSQTVEHYESLGYSIPRYIDRNGIKRVRRGTSILVKIDDLTEGSNAEVTKICDICNINKKTRYHDIIEGRERNSGIDQCKSCSDKRKLSSFHSNNTRINSILATNPDFVKLLWDKDDSYKYTQQSNKKIDFKCPTCGNKVKNKRIQDVYKYGLSCSQCSDGVSYPEKFISNMLCQLEKEYEFQKSFPWSKGKKYDFYIISKDCIIESHGKQHYVHSSLGRTLFDEKENDRIKENLANKNGIKTYIVINCELSEMNHIRNSLENSEVSSFRNFEKIDWLKCHEFACTSFVKIACECFNSGMSISEISNQLKLNRSTIRNYLKQGLQLEWCNYDPEEEKTKRVKKIIRGVIQLNLDSEYVAEYESIIDAERSSGILASSIGNACKKRIKTAGGYKWMYREDYIKE